MIKLGLYVVACIGIHFLTLKLIRSVGATQKIYDLSPSTHQEKSNTPTLGGLGIVFCLIFGFIFFYHYLILPHFWLLCLGCGFALIGLLDDILSLKRASNKGLSARHKFALQVLVTGLSLWWFSSILTTPLPLWTWLFYGFVIVGSSNATNLSDGLDGLLAGLATLSFFGFFVWASILNHLVDASFILIGLISCATFLVVNRRPAKIFMGDTGSLCIGALLAGWAIYLGHPWMLLGFGAVYVLETCSVMAQVLWYKLFKKRIFLMAPLHHHFELMGMSERQVVWLFWGLGLSFIVIYYMLW